MLGFERKTIDFFLIRIILAVGLTLVMPPSTSNAEPLVLQNNLRDNISAPETARQNVSRSTTFLYNKNGDLVLRHSDIILTMACNPTDIIIELPDRNRLMQPSGGFISGIRVTLSLLF